MSNTKQDKLTNQKNSVVKSKKFGRKLKETTENIKGYTNEINYNLNQGKQILIEMVQLTNPQGTNGHFFNNVKDIAMDESNMHKAVQKLVNTTQSIYDKNSKDPDKFPLKTQLAALSFMAALRNLLSIDSKNLLSKSVSAQKELANKTNQLIYNYKPELETAPGFWNQLQAVINQFFEHYCGIENAFGKTPGTVFASPREFQDCKREIIRLEAEFDKEEEKNKRVCKQ